MSDELPPLPSDIRALIDADRRNDAVPEEARRRLLRKVGAAVLAGGAASVALSATATVAKGGVLSTLGAFLSRKGSIAATAFLVGGAAGAGGYAATTKVVRVEAPAAVCPSVVATAPSSPPKVVYVPAAPSPSPSASASTPPPIVVAPVASPAVGQDVELKEQRMLVEQANAALSRGEPANALATANRCNARFAEECEFVAIRALVQLGRSAEARSRADAFRKRFPKSIYLAAIDKLLP